MLCAHFVLHFYLLQPILGILKAMSRWRSKLYKRSKSNSENKLENGNEYHHHVECYACAQMGVPVFHSTSCDPANQPQWEALAGSSLFPIKNRSSRNNFRRTERLSTGNRLLTGCFERVLDPRSKWVQRWNRLILLARGVSLAVDPMFFFVLAIHGGGVKPCIYVDGRVAIIVSLIRTWVDAVHVWHIWLQFRLAYVSKESLVVGCGKLVWDAHAITSNYLRSLDGFWLDLFVILPIPQVVYWLVVPKLLRENRTGLMMAILQISFLFQFLPKIYHSFRLMRKMRKVTGYIFGTIWWGFGLNLVAYFLASHASGGYWYMLAIQRIASCLVQHSDRSKPGTLSLTCTKEVGMSHQTFQDLFHQGNSSTTSQNLFCLDDDGPFPFGLYKFALPLISGNSVTIKILYSNLWGLMALSTMGNNLQPTSQWLEVVFAICMVLFGLLLFTLLIGNIQVFLHAVMARRRKMQLKYRDMERWMNRRQLPSHLRQRVRDYEHQTWETMGGQDENELIKDFPDGLRRDIKRYLCLDLIKKVPLFHNLDDVIVDNIIDRLKPLVYSQDEKIIREGDLVQRIIFIARGRVKRRQRFNKGTVAATVLEPGSFLGDELLSWTFHRPFLERLPVSSATFTCTEPVEAFGLSADDLRFITDQFRYRFVNEKLKRTARYYSSNWRTWAAVNIQLAWRSYVGRSRGLANNGNENGGNQSERRLQRCAAFFMSLRPHDHLE